MELVVIDLVHVLIQFNDIILPFCTGVVRRAVVTVLIHPRSGSHNLPRMSKPNPSGGRLRYFIL